MPLQPTLPSEEPANWLGVERWTLGSLTKAERRDFLRAWRRLLARFLHPDTAMEPEVKTRRAYYFSHFSAAVDAFLATPVLPDQARDPTVPFKLRILDLQKENRELRARLERATRGRQ